MYNIYNVLYIPWMFFVWRNKLDLSLNVELHNGQESRTASCLFSCLIKLHLRLKDAGHLPQLNILYF